MDGYARKRSSDGLGFSRRSSSLNIRDNHNEGKGIKYCNKLGCSTRLSSMKGTPIGNQEMPKFSKASLRITSSKFVAGSSSKMCSSPSETRKSHQEKQVRTPIRDTADPEASEVIPTTFQPVLPESEGPESPVLQGLSKVQTKAMTSRQQKQIHHRIGSSSQDTPSSSSIRRSVVSKNIVHVTKPCSYPGSGAPRYGLNNFSSSSISNVLPSGCSSSNLCNNKKATSVRYRSSDGESSSSGGKSSSGSSISSLSSSSGSLMPQVVRRTKSRPTSRDGPVSVRTRRAPVRSSEQQNDDSVLIAEPVMYPQLPHSQLSILESVPESSSRSFPLEAPPIFHSSAGIRPIKTVQLNGRSARSRHELLRDRDGYRHFNTEGIAEVLLALERIEQDDELTYEQLMVLETNLLLGGFTFHDRHRDMRLDIDNMTYEELLALEEKMGTVSTALSEEALSKCLKRSIYLPKSRITVITSCGDVDAKCSICQEEYVGGEELGKLACEHRYHADCIYQWLRQKNWCPICKTSAASPSEERTNLRD